MVSLSSGGTGGPKSNGLNQYYTNPAALQKLLNSITLARNNEIGRVAAYEYEQMAHDDNNYLTSVKRMYQRTSIISKVEPTLIFIKIDPEASGTCDSQEDISRKT